MDMIGISGEVGVHVAIGVSISAAVIGLTVIIVALACKHFYKRYIVLNIKTLMKITMSD